VTFDPDRDTADALRAYSTERGIDPAAGHWHYLRPEDNETAKTVLNETFGLPLRRNEESSNNESTNETAAGNESSGADGLGTRSPTPRSSRSSTNAESSSEHIRRRAGNVTQ